MDVKFFSIGMLLLVLGIFFIYGYFAYPEYFLWAGLGGILALLSPFIAVVLGIGFIYGSFSKEEVPPPFKTSVIVDDWIIEEALDEKKSEAEEIADCKKHLEPDEKLLMIVASRTESARLNRVALTDNRVIFYQKGKFQSGTSFDYGEIDDAERRQSMSDRLTGHLADVLLSAKETTLKFEKVGIEWADEVISTISKMKKQTPKRVTPTPSPKSKVEAKTFCTNCGKPVKPKEKFCGSCGKKLT